MFFAQVPETTFKMVWITRAGLSAAVAKMPYEKNHGFIASPKGWTYISSKVYTLEGM